MEFKERLLACVRGVDAYSALMAPLTTSEEHSGRIDLAEAFAKLLQRCGSSPPPSLPTQDDRQGTALPCTASLASTKSQSSYASAAARTPLTKAKAPDTDKSTGRAASEKKRISPAHHSVNSSVPSGARRLFLAPSMSPLRPATAPVTLEECAKLGELYAHLVLTKCIPLSTGVPLLVALLQLYPSLADNSCELFGDKTQLSAFLVTSTQALAPLLFLMGRRFLKAFTKLDFIRSRVASLVEVYENSWDDDEEFTMHTRSNESSNPEYLRPFVESSDSRNEYKSQFDMQMYNERERVYDAFANLFRSYQNSSNSQDFWAQVKGDCTRLLDFSPFNMEWFTDLFVDMLVFYGQSEVVQPSKVDSASPGLTALQGEMNEVRQRKLEERIGPGRGGGSRRQSGSSFGSLPRAASKAADLYSTQAEQFKGAEQFFFRFVLLANNNSFNRMLEVAIICEVQRLSGEICREDSPSSGIDFSAVIEKLRTLGRFHGLVLFSPRWALAFPDGYGKVAAQSRAYSARKLRAYSLILPHVESIRLAAQNGTLCVAMPWIAESLKMLRFDADWVDSVRGDTEAFRLLRQVVCSEEFCVAGTRFTPHRLIVLSEIELLLQLFCVPASILRDCVTVLSPPLSSFDDRSPFSDFCFESIVPFLKESLAIMALKASPSIKMQKYSLALRTSKLSSSLCGETPTSRENFSPQPLGRSSSIATSPVSSTKPQTLKIQLFPTPSSAQKSKAPSHELTLRSACQSFLQQHPAQQKVSTLLLDLFQQSGTVRLRDRVAQAVRELWGRAATLKEKYSEDNACDLSFESSLRIEAEAVISSAVDDGRLIVDALYRSGVDRVLPELCNLSSSDERVSSLSVHLIRKQMVNLERQLGDFMLKFVRRKLEEVEVLSIQQYLNKRSDDRENLSAPLPPIVHENHRSGVFPAEALVACLKRCSLHVAFSGPSDLTFDDNECIHQLSTLDFTVSRLSPTRLPLHFSLLDRCDYVNSLLSQTVVALSSIVQHESFKSVVVSESLIRLSNRVYEVCVVLIECIYDSFLGNDAESRGRVRIEVAKLLCTIIFHLLSLDYCLRVSELRFSSLIVIAVQQDLISIDSTCRILGNALKPGCAAFYRSCGGVVLEDCDFIAVLRRLTMCILISVGASGFVEAHEQTMKFPDMTLLEGFNSHFSSEVTAYLHQLNKAD